MGVGKLLACWRVHMVFMFMHANTHLHTHKYLKDTRTCLPLVITVARLTAPGYSHRAKSQAKLVPTCQLLSACCACASLSVASSAMCIHQIRFTLTLVNFSCGLMLHNLSLINPNKKLL